MNFGNNSHMPKIQVALNPWLDDLTFIKVTQENKNFLTTTTNQTFFFQGTVQPLSPRELAIKPIGERRWGWWMIHSLTQLSLEPGDKIILGNDTYKVMAKNNYSRDSYYEYHIVRNYEEAL